MSKAGVTVNLLSLPNEILFQISHRLNSPSSLAALCLTSKRLNEIGTPVLYQKEYIDTTFPVSWLEIRPYVHDLAQQAFVYLAEPPIYKEPPIVRATRTCNLYAANTLLNAGVNVTIPAVLTWRASGNAPLKTGYLWAIDFEVRDTGFPHLVSDMDFRLAYRSSAVRIYDYGWEQDKYTADLKASLLRRLIVSGLDAMSKYGDCGMDTVMRNTEDSDTEHMQIDAESTADSGMENKCTEADYEYYVWHSNSRKLVNGYPDNTTVYTPPIVAASILENIPAVKLLLSYDMVVPKGLLTQIAVQGTSEVVRCLLDSSTTTFTQEEKGEAFIEAACCGQIESMKVLLSQDIKREDISLALLRAVEAAPCFPGVMKFLLSLKPTGIIGSEVLGEALIEAAWARNNEVVKILLKRDTETRAKTIALCKAADKGEISTIELLLHHGAEISGYGREGAYSGQEYIESNIPVVCAAAGGHIEAVGLLLDHGADLNAEDSQKNTAIAHVRNFYLQRKDFGLRDGSEQAMYKYLLDKSGNLSNEDLEMLNTCGESDTEAMAIDDFVAGQEQSSADLEACIAAFRGF
jgi:hypothetical protein